MNQKSLLNKYDFYLIGITFILLYSFFFSNVERFSSFGASNDYLFHLYRAEGKCEELITYSPVKYYSIENCKNYPVGYYVLSSFFGWAGEMPFFAFNLIILCFLIPLILKRLVNNNWIIPLYFSCSFLYNVIYAGIFPQMLIALCFLCYLLFRNSQYKYLFVGIGIFSHNLGLPFFAFVMLIDFLFNFLAELYKEADFNFQQKQDYFYSLIPVFPILKQVTLGERLIDSLIKPMPFIFAWIGLKKMIQQRMFFLLAILIITIIYAFVDLRTLLFSEIILIIPASMYLSESKKSFKILSIILILLCWFFNLVYWINSSYSLFTGVNFI